MFYERFLELCREKGVKPTNACIEAGLSRGLAAKWKATGTEKPSTDVLEKISVYFGKSIDEILGNEKKPAADSSELDKELKGIDFALYGEVKELTDGQKQDVLDFIRFKKAQDQNRGK